jgi:hypothetical protein
VVPEADTAIGCRSFWHMINLGLIHWWCRNNGSQQYCHRVHCCPAAGRPLTLCRHTHKPKKKPKKQNITQRRGSQVIQRLAREVMELVRSPPEGITYVATEEDTIQEIQAEISGPGEIRGIFFPCVMGFYNMGKGVV